MSTSRRTSFAPLTSRLDTTFLLFNPFPYTLKPAKLEFTHIRCKMAAAAAAAPLFICFDLETTGLRPVAGGILELAAVTHDARATFERFVRPNPLAIPDAAHAVHGISLEDVRGATAFADVWTAFVEWVQALRRDDTPVVMIAHNCFGFDMQWLVAGGVSIPDWMTFADSLPAAKQLRSQASSVSKWQRKECNLQALADAYLSQRQREGIGNAHRALADAETLRRVVFASALDGMQAATLATARRP